MLFSKSKFNSVALLSLLTLCAGPMTHAEVPVYSQKLFDVHVNLKPNRLLPIPANRITGDVPVIVLTDGAKRIVGIQVGAAGNWNTFNFDMKDGTKEKQYFATAIAPTELLAKKKYAVNLKVPVFGQRELFFVDGSRIHPERGGPLSIRYVSSPLLGTSHDVNLNLTQVNGNWVATSTEKGMMTNKTQYVGGVEVNTSITGLGFSEPQLSTLNPNQILTALNPVRINDPRAATRMMQSGRDAMEIFEKYPMDIGHGVQFRLDSKAAVAR